MFSTEQAQIDGSDREPEDRHDAVHRLVLPTYCAASVSRIVPVTRTGGEKKYDGYFKFGHSNIYKLDVKNLKFKIVLRKK